MQSQLFGFTEDDIFFLKMAAPGVPNSAVSQPSVLFLDAYSAQDWVPSLSDTPGPLTFTVTLNQALVRPLRIKIKSLTVIPSPEAIESRVLAGNPFCPSTVLIGLSCVNNSESALAYSPTCATLAALDYVPVYPYDYTTFGSAYLGQLHWEANWPTIHNLNSSGNLSQIRVTLIDPVTGSTVQASWVSDIVLEVEIIYM